MVWRVGLSLLQFEVETLGAPLVDVTVQHVALGEADVVLAVDQDDRVGPTERGQQPEGQEASVCLQYFIIFSFTLYNSIKELEVEASKLLCQNVCV